MHVCRLHGTRMLIPSHGRLEVKYGKQGVDEAVSVLAGVPLLLERLTIWFVL